MQRLKSVTLTLLVLLRLPGGLVPPVHAISSGKLVSSDANVQVKENVIFLLFYLVQFYQCLIDISECYKYDNNYTLSECLAVYTSVEFLMLR